jgi:molybdenum cofactor cytidylyltransferase
MRLHLAVVILAAGRARRMGKPKLLLPWHGSTIIAHEIETWRTIERPNGNGNSGAEVRVVVGARPDPIQDELDRLHFPENSRIVNANPDDGMFSSIRCAARVKWAEELTHFAIILGDQPHLKRTTLQKVLHIAEEEFDSICQPRHGSKLAHPVILPRNFFVQLADTKFEKLSEFLADQDVEPVDVDDPGLELDIDVAADYEQALKVEQQAIAHH